MSESSLQDSLINPKLDHLSLENLSLKIAETEEEVKAAQRLRYEVFYKEMGATPTEAMAQSGLETDIYDPYCEHLLVVDNSAPIGEHIVGTYRILMKESADAQGIKLYTETEFDLTKLKATGKRIMEVSRSCVIESHRSKMAINLLWKGIAVYVFARKVDYLVGIPSMHGIDPTEHHDTLAYLNAFHLADESIRPRALDESYYPMPAVGKDSINVREAFKNLPPLVKGYLRIGAVVGEGAYIDRQFNSTDIAVIVDINNVSDRYFNHYKRADVE